MPSNVSRRNAVRALVLGSLGAWAGCTGSDPSSGDSTSRSGTATAPTSGRSATASGASESATPDTPQSLTFGNPTVQTGIATQWEDTIEVRGGGQYFTVEATVDGEDHGPPLGAFEFVFDGERHEPYDPENMLAARPRKYRADTGGRIVFRLPEQASRESARLVWPGGEWTPPKDVRERLGSPLPTFDVRVSAPDEIEGFERPTLSITVTNEGDVPGRHVVGVDQKGPGGYFATVGRFAFDLAPGETETRTHTGSPPGWDGGPRREIVYTVHLPNGALGRTIRPPDEETTSRE